MKKICLAGGVALNCVSNGKLLRSGIFDDIFIQPASGDAGGAIGAAYYTWHQVNNNKRIINNDDSMQGCYLGPEFDNEEICQTTHLLQKPICFESVSNCFCNKTVSLCVVVMIRVTKWE